MGNLKSHKFLYLSADKRKNETTKNINKIEKFYLSLTSSDQWIIYFNSVAVSIVTVTKLMLRLGLAFGAEQFIECYFQFHFFFHLLLSILEIL